jgi:hypothetical protein
MTHPSSCTVVWMLPRPYSASTFLVNRRPTTMRRPTARTEGLRALRWVHVHIDGNPSARPPMPPQMEVWRSVRQGGDTKTRKSPHLGSPGPLP